MQSLDARERLFVEEYLVDLNAPRAALKAGYSETMAYSKAYQWVRDGKRKPHVYAAVQARLQKRDNKIQSRRERIIAEYEKLAFFDVRKLFDEDGNPKSLHELDDDTAAAVAGFDLDVEVIKPEQAEIDAAAAKGDEPPTAELHKYVKKIKLSEKKAALDSLSKIEGMFIEKHEHTGKDGAPIEMKDEGLTDMELARRVAFLLAGGSNKLKENK